MGGMQGGGGRRIGAMVAALATAVTLAGCYPQVPDPAWEPAAGAVRQIEGRAPRVLVFGDSIADQHGSHAVEALRDAGVETSLDAWWGWNLFTPDQYDMGVTNPDPPATSMMAAATTAVEGFDPDVVVLYSNHNYWAPFPRDAAGRTIAYGSPQFTAMAQTQLTELVARLSALGARVYLVSPVPEEGGETTADNAIWTAYLGVRDELGFGVINSGDILASIEGVRVEDLYDCAAVSTRVRPADDLHLTYFGSGLMGTITARAVADVLGVPLRGNAAPSDAPTAIVPHGDGYRLVTCDGATFRARSGGPSLGSTALGAGRPAGDPVVAATTAPAGGSGSGSGSDPGEPTPTWTVTGGGAVLELGGATELDDVSPAEGERVTGIAATASGRGAWVVTDRGVVHRRGDAPALGDLGGRGEQVVAMAGTPDRDGYWLLTASGRVVPFGGAGAFGDLAGAPPAHPPVALAAHPSGAGYWVLDAGGHVHAFGAAPALGSTAGQDLLRIVGWNWPEGVDYEVVPAAEVPTTAVDLLPTPSGDGYWVWLANGAVCHFGDATTLGGIHRGQLDFAMVLLGLPFYGAGPCAQTPDAPRPDATGAAATEPLETMAETSDSALVEVVDDPANLNHLPPPPPGDAIPTLHEDSLPTPLP